MADDLLGTSSGLIGDPPPPGLVGFDTTQTNPMEFFLRSVPGYKFAFDEGQRAVQSSAASRGTLLTGGTLKALTKYGTGVADQLYGDTVNRYLSLADLGLRGATAPFV